MVAREEGPLVDWGLTMGLGNTHVGRSVMLSPRTLWAFAQRWGLAGVDRGFLFGYRREMRSVPGSLLAVICGACAATPSKPAASDPGGPPPRWAAALDAAARALVASRRVEGLSVAAVKGDETWSQAYGEAAAGQQAQLQTVYETGSVTKVFTALLLADAIERGEVDPDATIRDVAPELDLPDEVAAVRLQALANHSSGLPRMPSNFAPADASDPYADHDNELLWQGLAEVELGPQRYAYSNLGMAVLGQLLARRAGTTYAELLKQRVLAPLDLGGLRLTAGEGDAQPHDDMGAPQTDWTFDAFAPAGALRGKAPQLLRFVRAQVNPKTVDAPLGPAMERTQSQTIPLPGEGGVGLGWHIDGAGNRWHNGQTLGSHAFVGLKPSAHGVVVLSNSASAEVDRLGRGMLTMLAGEDPGLEFAPRVDLSPEQLKRYEGEYVIQPEFILTITARNGRLYIQATGQPAIPLTAVGDHVFEISALGASGRFIVPEEGPASALIWNQGGQRTKAPRK